MVNGVRVVAILLLAVAVDVHHVDHGVVAVAALFAAAPLVVPAVAQRGVSHAGLRAAGLGKGIRGVLDQVPSYLNRVQADHGWVDDGSSGVVIHSIHMYNRVTGGWVEGDCGPGWCITVVHD